MKLQLIVFALAFLQPTVGFATATPQTRQAFSGLGDEIDCSDHETSEWQAIVENISAFLDSNPTNYEALATRGAIYSCLGREDLALADFNKSLIIMPSAQLYYSRALSYEHFGMLDNAIDDLTKAINLNPNDAKLFSGRAIDYEIKGQVDKSLADYAEAIRLFPQFADAYVNRGRLYSGYGSATLAFADFAKAIEINPSDAFAYINRGVLYFTLRKYPQAIQDFDKAHDLMPNEPVALLNGCETRVWANTDLDTALKDCDADLTLRPNHQHTLTVRAILYLRENKLDLALADDNAALNFDPQDRFALYTRGLVKLRKGDTSGGNADLNTARAVRRDVDAYFVGIGLTPN